MKGYAPLVSLAFLLGSLVAVPAPAAADEEFGAGLHAPVSLDDVAVEVAEDEVEIAFELREVGRVIFGVDAGDDGTGRGFVTVGDALIAEVEFVDGAVVSETSEFSALSPEQARAVVASLVQVWHEEDVMTAFMELRDFKCWWAGKIAGATIGVAVFAGCGLATKNPKCYGWGIGVGSGLAGYITNKCNGAQNK